MHISKQSISVGFGSGFSFGASTSTAAPTFGGFGSTTTTSNTTPNFGFGSSFGTPATTVPVFGGLGSATTSAPSFGGFGTTTTPSSGFGGFGSLSTSTATPSLGTFSGFGTTTATTTTPSLFGGLGTSTGAPGSTFGGLGSSFGKPIGSASGWQCGGLPVGGGFSSGIGFGAGTSFGQTQQQPQQQQQPTDPNQVFINAILGCNVFGDERDTVLAKWNLLQASWGCGKGYYSQNQPTVDFTPENPYCRFKAVGYSAMPMTDNKDGQVILAFNKKEAELKSQQAQIQTTITNILGNKPELQITLEEIKPLSDVKSQLTIWVQERSPTTGAARRIPATELSTFLMQPVPRQQLSNIAVENIFPNVKPDSDQIKEYLDNPPAGLDPRLWKQAQLDNPNPDKFLPVPIIGFDGLKWRMQIQENETALHRAYLDRVSEDIIALKRKYTSSVAQIAELKRKFVDLQHRILKVIARQEMCRKVGMALQPEEEQLRIQLENLQQQISVPSHFRGRLTELLAHVRIQRGGTDSSTVSGPAMERYTIEPGVQDDVKEFLKLEQTGIAHLINTINTDLSHLNIIKDGMLQILPK